MTDLERELSNANREMPVPEHLEQRVIATLKSQGLIQTEGTRPASLRAFHWWGALLAASIAAFFVGLVAGRSGDERAFPRGQFMLLLYEGPEYVQTTEDNFDLRFEEYNRWIAALRASENFVTGEQLDSTGMIVLPPTTTGVAAIVENRMAASADGVLGGMFLISAASYEEALAIARTAPHLRFGGRVAVRRITPI